MTQSTGQQPRHALIHTTVQPHVRVEYRAAMKRGLVELDIRAIWGRPIEDDQIADRLTADGIETLCGQLMALAAKARLQIQEIAESKHEPDKSS